MSPVLPLIPVPGLPCSAAYAANHGAMAFGPLTVADHRRDSTMENLQGIPVSSLCLGAQAA